MAQPSCLVTLLSGTVVSGSSACPQAHPGLLAEAGTLSVARPGTDSGWGQLEEPGLGTQVWVALVISPRP